MRKEAVIGSFIFLALAAGVVLVSSFRPGSPGISTQRGLPPLLQSGQARTETGRSTPVLDHGAKPSHGRRNDSGGGDAPHPRLVAPRAGTPSESASLLRSAIASGDKDAARTLMSAMRQHARAHKAGLLELAQDSSLPQRFRIWAMSVVKKTGGADTVDSLLALFTNRDESLHIRCYAAYCLAELPDQRMVSPLVTVANDGSHRLEIRAAAVLGLSQFSSHPHVHGLLTRLSQQEDGPRLAKLSLSALGSASSGASVAALSTGADSERYEVRVAAVQSLSKLAASADLSVSVRAQHALESTGFDVISELAPGRADKRRMSAEENVARYRWMSATVHALNYAYSPQAARILADIYAGATGPRLRQDVVSVAGGLAHSEASYNLLLRGLSDPVPKIRMVSARSLLLLTKGEAIPLVKDRMTSETDDAVRRDMARALRSYLHPGSLKGATR